MPGRAGAGGHDRFVHRADDPPIDEGGGIGQRGPAAATSSRRFRVLLAEDDRRYAAAWTRTLAPLLEPHGVQTLHARTAAEAIDLAAAGPLDVAIIDAATPRLAHLSEPAGLYLLEVLHRSPHRPHVVLVNSQTYSARLAHRLLSDALRLGAFAVIDRTGSGQVEMNHLLGVFARLLDRAYQGRWPAHRPNAPDPPPPSEPAAGPPRRD